jgi:hypothetical protein
MTKTRVALFGVVLLALVPIVTAAQSAPAARGAARGTAAQAPAPASTPASAARKYPPLGTVAQLMRGIFFTNSNLIFTVQTRDPGAPAPPPSPSTPAATGGFSFTDWGAGIYTGWQLVDNAAVALVDVSPLLLSADLKCENGRAAPVTDPEWIKFTDDMIAVSKKIYAASRMRNQEAVADATGDLSDSCAACHQAYRDVRGRGANPPDLTNISSRCISRVR